MLQTFDPRSELSDLEIAEKQDEELKEARWCEFVAWARQGSVPVMLNHVAQLMQGQRDPYIFPVHLQARYLDFMETEGWDGVLNAIARAIREQAADAAETFTRR